MSYVENISRYEKNEDIDEFHAFLPLAFADVVVMSLEPRLAFIEPHAEVLMIETL